MMDWDDLRFFLAVAQSGTVSAAAKSLAVNYTTVNRRINQFEDKLGIRLFNRLASGYTLTEEGVDLLSSSEVISSEFQFIETRLMGKDNRLRGIIRLDTTDHIARLLMPELQRFMQHYPDIELQLITNAKTISLSRRDADISIRLTDSPPDNLHAIKLGDVLGNLYASPNYLKKHQHITDLSKYSWIGWDNSCDGGRSAKFVESKMPLGAKIGFRVNCGISLYQAIKNGLGVGFMWEFVADPDPYMIRVKADLPSYTLGLWLLVHKDLCNSTRFRVFLAFIEKAMKRHIDLNSGCLQADDKMSSILPIDILG